MIMDVLCLRQAIAVVRPFRIAVTGRLRSGPGKGNSSLGRFPTFPALTVGICLLAKFDASVLPIGLFVVQHFSYWVVGLD